MVKRTKVEAQVPVDCLLVFRELSNYLEAEIAPATRARMEAHFKECAHCTAVLDGTRNILRLVGDGRSFELPRGFSLRLKQRLAMSMKKNRKR